MDFKQTLRWAGAYLTLWLVAAVIGLAFVAAGVVLGLGEAYRLYYEGAAMGRVVGTAAPGIVLALLGALLWKLGAAVAFYKTLTGAVEMEMGERFDSEKVKSDILSVLDDRLSDMQYEINRTRKDVNKLNREDAAEEFEFNN